MTKLIPATRGYSALVDDEDFEVLSQYRWFAASCGNRRVQFRPLRHTPRDANGRYKIVFLYRQILNARPGQVVDHINGDAWDNRRSNLRLCTRGENACNSPGHRNRKWPYKGICKKRQKFFARIIFKGREYTASGAFETPEEAARAYDRLALELHGEFACLNFPEAA